MQYYNTFLVVLVLFLILTKLWLFYKSRNEYYAANVFAHFGGIPNDSQLWGYQVRTIF